MTWCFFIENNYRPTVVYSIRRENLTQSVNSWDMHLVQWLNKQYYSEENLSLNSPSWYMNTYHKISNAVYQIGKDQIYEDPLKTKWHKYTSYSKLLSIRWWQETLLSYVYDERDTDPLIENCVILNFVMSIVILYMKRKFPSTKKGQHLFVDQFLSVNRFSTILLHIFSPVQRFVSSGR